MSKNIQILNVKGVNYDIALPQKSKDIVINETIERVSTEKGLVQRFDGVESVSVEILNATTNNPNYKIIYDTKSLRFVFKVENTYYNNCKVGLHYNTTVNGPIRIDKIYICGYAIYVPNKEGNLIVQSMPILDFDGTVRNPPLESTGLSDYKPEFDSILYDITRKLFCVKRTGLNTNYYNASPILSQFNSINLQLRQDVLYRFKNTIYTYNKDLNSLSSLDGTPIGCSKHGAVKPIITDVPVGFMFFHDTKGYPIFKKDNDTWVNATGKVEQ